MAWMGQMEAGDKIINYLNIVHNMTKKVDVSIFLHSPGVTALQLIFQPGPEL